MLSTGVSLRVRFTRPASTPPGPSSRKSSTFSTSTRNSIVSVHRTEPVTWRGKSGADLSRIDDWARGDVRDDRERRRLHRGRGELRRKRVSGALHEARVIRAGDVQLCGLADAAVAHDFQQRIDLRILAGEHDLAGAVEICHVHAELRGDLAHDGFIAADQRRHRAGRAFAGFLHQASALGDELQSVGKCERPRSGVRGEFAKRKSRRDVHRQLADFRAQRGEAGEAVDEQRGLAVCRLHELRLRTRKGDGAERTAEDRIRLAEKITRRRVLRGEIPAHAHGLGALPGKKECDAFCHALAYCKRRRAGKTARDPLRRGSPSPLSHARRSVGSRGRRGDT